ncbi:MAG: hypothetical protein AAF613_09405 [Pseudomonadota bacterium]
MFGWTRLFLPMATLAAVLTASGPSAWGAPGDQLLSDNFDSGGGCGSFATNWTTTNSNLGGVSTQTSQSGNCSMFLRGDEVSNTSNVIDLSAVTGADLDVWIRQGSDAFSEDPDPSEDLVVEYLNASGIWTSIEQYDGGLRPVGTVFTIDMELPLDALHSAFQLRFRHLGGNGGPPANGGIGWDYWHVDDVIVTETNNIPPPPPTSNLASNTCDDFESGFGNWTTTNGARSAINSDTSLSASNSLYLRNDPVVTTSLPFNSGGVDEITVWVRRGSNTFSNFPEGGENMTFEYLNNVGAWVTLETFFGGGTAGQQFNRTYALPTSAQHANFQVRFDFAGGSGFDFDYWHIDDLCFNGADPDFEVVKTVSVEWDPINDTTNPLGIPGSWAVYAVTVTNNGAGSVDAGSMRIGDSVDDKTTMFTGDFDGFGSPFRFTDGAGADSSGLSLIYGGVASTSDGVTFRNAVGTEIIPNGAFDPSVASFELQFNGAMDGIGTGGNPTFTIEYRVLVE